MNKIILFTIINFIFRTSFSQTETSSYQQFRSSQHDYNTKNGNTIKYIDKGQGPVVLLLHGVPSSSWLYRKMIDSLVHAGHRVIAPDMLGFGNSDSPKGYEIYHEKNHAKRLLNLMNHLKIETWSHVFHDAGGLWTWELIKIAPNRISTLIILNTIIYKEGFNPPIKMKEGNIAKFSMWMYKNGVTTNLLLKKLFKVGLLNSKIMTENDIEGYKTPLKEGKTRAMYYFFTQTCHNMPNNDTLLSSIKIPSFIIWGEHDEMLQIKPQIDKMKSNMNIKESHFIEARHFIQEEKPQLVSSLIIDFIK